jgi:hypothetical protein
MHHELERLFAGCPDCPTQVEAWAEVLRSEPFTWLLVSITPFVAIALIATASHRIGRVGSSPDTRKQ